MSPSLSFVVPTRILGRLLDERLRGLLEALDDCANRFEVLMVDEGCEESREAAERVVSEFAQVRIVRREAEDVAFRRTAARHAQGELIVIYRTDPWSLAAAVEQIRQTVGDQLIVSEKQYQVHPGQSRPVKRTAAASGKKRPSISAALHAAAPNANPLASGDNALTGR